MAASAWGSLSGANVLVWIGIALCITQSAIFSGYAGPFRQREPVLSEDDVIIDNDLILVWGDQKRIITGSDLLGRLSRGIVTRDADRN
jgi:hypothetical protein